MMNRSGKYQDDLNLVQKYLDQDARVERLFYHEVTRLIRNMIRAMAKRGSVFFDQENVVSEIVFEIMLKDDRRVLRAYEGKSKLATYLWPIVRFRLIDMIRREHRYHATFTRAKTAEPHSSNPGSAEPVADIIHDHIRNEPPEHRFIKTARWIEDLSYSEIITRAEASKMTLDTNRIAYVLHSNRKVLEKKLKKYGI
ncbi:sigma-70 family RNA polymerase sigma factor [bacterium]|nr:sigma-70 family RNA polymerase sigma factor [bacterium]